MSHVCWYTLTYHTFWTINRRHVVSCRTDSKVVIRFMLVNNAKLNDCIRSTTAVCNPRPNLRQNSVRDKFSPKQNPVWEKYFLLEKIGKKIVSDIVLDFQYTKWAVSDKSMLITTKQYVHAAENRDEKLTCTSLPIWVAHF